ncbi:hypothetical protein GCM10028832_14500 [Streptomyces sparsus]
MPPSGTRASRSRKPPPGALTESDELSVSGEFVVPGDVGEPGGRVGAGESAWTEERVESAGAGMLARRASGEATSVGSEEAGVGEAAGADAGPVVTAVIEAPGCETVCLDSPRTAHEEESRKRFSERSGGTRGGAPTAKRPGADSAAIGRTARTRPGPGRRWAPP